MRDAAELTKLVPTELCFRRRLIPVSLAVRSRIIAMADPSDPAAMAAVGQMTGSRIEPVIASQAQIEEASAKHFEQP